VYLIFLYQAENSQSLVSVFVGFYPLLKALKEFVNHLLDFENFL